MSADDPRLLDLADAILDGRPIDWQAAAARLPIDQRALLDDFRAIASLSSFHIESTIAASASSDSRSADAIDRPRAASTLDDERTQWGPLSIEGLIGRGRFGDVYRAIDPRLDRPVALKLLRRSAAGAPDAGSTAIEEGRLMARVRHPNVVTVYGAERIEGRVGLWMELIDGRTLEIEVRERGPLPWREVAEIGRDLCRALTAVHRAGLLHRDLKAQNVIREPDGRVVLADFGAGVVLNEQVVPDLAGTPLYLAPEIFAGAPPSERADVYSLGVLLFHLVTASFPVRGRSLSDLRDAHRQRSRTRLRDARSDLAPAFVNAVDVALAASPAHRHANAQALERALAASLTVTEDIGVDRSPAVAGLPPATARPRLIARAAAAVLVAAATIAMVSLKSRLQQRNPSAATTNAAAATLADLAAPRKIRMPSFDMGIPSYNGRAFPYFADDGSLQLWDVATGISQRVVAPPSTEESGRSPIASPDATRIAYGWSLGDGAFELRTINADGRWPRVLITRQTAFEAVPVDWSRDGQHLLCWLRQKNGSADLVLIPAEGGQPRLIHTFASAAPGEARLSPDGRFVAMPGNVDGATARGGVWVMPIEGGEPRLLVEGANPELGPRWVADGTHIVFFREASAPVGSTDMWAIAISDGRAVGPPALIKANVGFGIFHVLRTDTLYQSLTIQSVDVYTAVIDLSGASPAGPPSRISPTEVGNHVAPAWSPDGAFIAYFTTSESPIPGAGPSRTLTIQDVATGVAQKLPLALWFVAGYRPTWSPDGRSMVVTGTNSPTDRPGYYRIDLPPFTSSMPRTAYPVTLLAVGDSDAPPFSQFSADARQFWFIDHARGVVAKNLVDGREDVVIAKAARDAITRFFLATNGHAVAFNSSLRRGDGWISQIELYEPGHPIRLLARSTTATVMQLHGWTPDGRSLLYSSGQGGKPYPLVRLDLAGGPPVSLGFSMTPTPNPIVLSPDGSRIAYPERMHERELWITQLPR